MSDLFLDGTYKYITCIAILFLAVIVLISLGIGILIGFGIATL